VLGKIADQELGKLAVPDKTIEKKRIEEKGPDGPWNPEGVLGRYGEAKHWGRTLRKGNSKRAGPPERGRGLKTRQHHDSKQIAVGGFVLGLLGKKKTEQSQAEQETPKRDEPSSREGEKEKSSIGDRGGRGDLHQDLS